MKMHYRNVAGIMGTSNNLEEEIFAFAPGGGVLYNYGENIKIFAGAYKGFNVPSPGTARTMEHQLKRKLV